MARYAMVHETKGFVASVVEWDGDTTKWGPPPDYVMVEDDPPAAVPGGTFDAGVFTPPPGGFDPMKAANEAAAAEEAAAKEEATAKAKKRPRSK